MEFTLDARSTAIILIDLQRSIAERQLAPHTSDTVLKNASSLAAILRAKGGTVIYVRLLASEVLQLPVDAPNPRPAGGYPPNAFDLVPESGVQPTDLVVTKRQWGAFYGTDLEQQLRRRFIRTIVLGGIATNIGVESTARAAFDQGYELVFAQDAMSSMSVEAHNFSVSNIFPRMGRVRSTAQIMVALS